MQLGRTPSLPHTTCCAPRQRRAPHSTLPAPSRFIFSRDTRICSNRAGPGLSCHHRAVLLLPTRTAQRRVGIRTLISWFSPYKSTPHVFLQPPTHRDGPNPADTHRDGGEGARPGGSDGRPRSAPMPGTGAGGTQSRAVSARPELAQKGNAAISAGNSAHRSGPRPAASRGGSEQERPGIFGLTQRAAPAPSSPHPLLSQRRPTSSTAPTQLSSGAEPSERGRAALGSHRRTPGRRRSPSPPRPPPLCPAAPALKRLQGNPAPPRRPPPSPGTPAGEEPLPAAPPPPPPPLQPAPPHEARPRPADPPPAPLTSFVAPRAAVPLSLSPQRAGGRHGPGSARAEPAALDSGRAAVRHGGGDRPRSMRRAEPARGWRVAAPASHSGGGGWGWDAAPRRHLLPAGAGMGPRCSLGLCEAGGNARLRPGLSLVTEPESLRDWRSPPSTPGPTPAHTPRAHCPRLSAASPRLWDTPKGW